MPRTKTSIPVNSCGLSQVKVHKQDRSIQTEYTYGQDPREYKGSGRRGKCATNVAPLEEIGLRRDGIGHTWRTLKADLAGL
jgi:hypothetical protein